MVRVGGGGLLGGKETRFPSHTPVLMHSLLVSKPPPPLKTTASSVSTLLLFPFYSFALPSPLCFSCSWLGSASLVCGLPSQPLSTPSYHSPFSTCSRLLASWVERSFAPFSCSGHHFLCGSATRQKRPNTSSRETSLTEASLDSEPINQSHSPGV